MSCENSNLIVVRLDLKERLAPANSISVYLTNRPVLNTNTSELFLPIVESVTGIGVQMDEWTPKLNNGSIKLRNGKDTLAFRRRFHDLSAKYAIMGARCRIYSADTVIIDDRPQDSQSLIWDGEIGGVESQLGGTANDDVSLTVIKTTKEFLVTKQLRVAEIPSLPDRSNNKFLPLVIGNGVQVTPYPLSQPEATTNDTFQQVYWAYATTLMGNAAPTFSNIGINAFLFRDIDERPGEDPRYLPCVSVPNTGDVIYNANGTVSSPLAFFGNMEKAKCFPIPFRYGTDPRYVVHAVSMEIRGNGFGGVTAPEGEIRIRIHGSRIGRRGRIRPKPLDDYLGEVVIDKADLNASNYVGSTSTVITIGGVFDKPIPFCRDYVYWLSITSGNDDNESKLNLPRYTQVAAQPTDNLSGSRVYYVQADDDNDVETRAHNVWRRKTADRSPKFNLFGLHLQNFADGDGYYDGNGLGLSYVRMRWNTVSSTDGGTPYESIEDITRLDWLMEIHGLGDDQGAVTGSVGAAIDERAHFALDVLHHTFDGEKWNPGNFDQSLYSDTHVISTDTGHPFYRKIGGRTYNKAKNTEVIREICRNIYGRLGYDGESGQYGIDYVGVSKDPSFTITDDDVRFERFFINPPKEVINSVSLNFDRRLDRAHFQRQTEQGDARDYANTIEFNVNNSSVGAAFSTDSLALYGEHRLQNENFDWLNHDVSAARVAELLLRLHDHPYSYVQFVAPEAKYKDLIKLFEVGEVRSTILPNFAGTEFDIYAHSPCGIVGQTIGVFQTYRIEIVAISKQFTPQTGGIIRALGRLLIHPNDPLNNYSEPE